MDREHNINRPESPSRRAALRRLAGAVAGAYVVPEVVFLSAARADTSTPSVPSPSSVDTSPVPTPAPSSGTGGTDVVDDSDDTDDTETTEATEGASSPEQVARETCSIPENARPDTISISRTDLSRSQDAIAAGYAKPLDQIWNEFIAGYDGKVLGVEFLDRKSNPRYRFRAISRSGRLETVTISAQTGVIQRIVGC